MPASPPLTKTMPFDGFRSSDLEIFDIPEFGARMSAIRGELRPRLVALGQDLAEPLATVLGAPLYAHAASHMRRRVNPPVVTWVAFARDARGYKRWVHFRVSVSGNGLRAVLFVEDDADDKPNLAGALQTEATGWVSSLSPSIEWCTLVPEGEAAPTTANLKAADLRAAGARLARVKLAKFAAGIPLPSDAATLKSPRKVRDAVLEAAEALAPLYRAAAGRPL